MVKAEVVLRPAVPADAPGAAPLIHAAGPTLFNLLFGPRTADTQRFLAALFARPRNPFSYENAVVAVQEGQIVGLAISADAAARRRVGKRMFWLAPALRGVLPLLRLLPNVFAIMGCTSAPPPGAYYLSILAVDAKARGQGIGSLLMDEVHGRARRAGCSVVALHAELDNEAAHRFYARHGYTEASSHTMKRALHLGISGFVALHRPLD